MAAPTRLSAEHELTLLLANTAARRHDVAAQIAALAARVDPERLLAHLERQRSVPLLGTRLLQAVEAPPHGFPQAVRSAVKQAEAEAWRHEVLLARVQAALTAAGVRAVPVKGLAVALRAHGAPGLREAADLDLLVDATVVSTALDELLALGLRQRPEPLDRLGRPLLHHVLVIEGFPPLELHWRVHWYEERFGTDLLARSEPHERLGWTPAPIDEFAALLLFYARDGFAGVRLAADAVAWWERHGAAVPAGALDAYLNRYPELALAWTATAAVLERILGLPRPIARAPGRRGVAAGRLANPFLSGEVVQMRAEIALVDGLLTPRGQVRPFLRRQLLLPLDVLDKQQPGLADRPVLSRAIQALTPLRILRRWAARLARPSRRTRALP